MDDGLSDWFNANFVKLGRYSAATGQVYQRVGYVPPAGPQA